jgi:hypothetical protein
VGGLRAKYRLIGNAVPPPLAEAVAQSVRRAKVTMLKTPDGVLEVDAAVKPRTLGGAGAVRIRCFQA